MRPAPTELASLEEIILPAWETNARVTRLLVAGLPPALWNQAVPGVPRRTVRMIAAHIHNARCGWVRTLGKPHGIRVPPLVDRQKVPKASLLKALNQSAAAMGDLLRFGCGKGGRIPPTRVYVWRNLALDVGHVLTYFVAHEAHHRGQLGLLARQLGAPLPETTRNKVWWWKPLATPVLAALCLTSSCRDSPVHARGIYIAHTGPHLLTMELRDSNRGILRPDISLTYALKGDTIIIQADPRGTSPPSPPSRFLVRRDTLRELNTSTPLVFVRQRN